MKKVQPRVFKLARQTERVALLLNIMDGVIMTEQIAEVIKQDVEPRPVRKPVVAFDRRFESVTAAAHWAIRWRPEFCGGGMNGEHATLERVRKSISRMASQDCWAGFYWSE